MKLFTGLVFCSLVLGVSSQGWFEFLGQAYDGKVTGGLAGGGGADGGRAEHMITRMHPECPSGLELLC